MSCLRLTHGAPPPAPTAQQVIVYPENDGRVLRVDQAGSRISISDPTLPNLIRNSGFWFWQASTPSSATVSASDQSRTSSVAPDGWRLSSTASVGITRVRVDTDSAPEIGLQARYYYQMTKPTSAGKMIMSQGIESRDVDFLRGSYFRIQLWMKGVSSSRNIRVAAVGHYDPASDPDTYPSNFFTATHVSGVDPTLASSELGYLSPKADQIVDNGYVEGSALTFNASMSWQRFGGVFFMPIQTRGIVVMVWTESDCPVGHGVAISQISLTRGDNIVRWNPLSFAQELRRCQRYIFKTFDLDTAPAAGVGANTGCLRGTLVKTGAVANAVEMEFDLPVRLISQSSALTPSIFNPVTAANFQVRQTGGATPGDLTSTSATIYRGRTLAVTATGLATGVMGDQVQCHVSFNQDL